jgi:hypothetical protein
MTQTLPKTRGLLRTVVWVAVLLLAPISGVLSASAQSGSQAEPYQRTYRQPKSVVEKALRDLQPAMGGHLPLLDGFAAPGEHPLNRYQRAYFQSTVQVNSTPSGGSVVRVSTKVTAWYTDSNPARSGYQLLTSNGRLESDLLDQLTASLANNSGATGSSENSTEGSSGVSTVPAPSATIPNQPAGSAGNDRRTAVKGTDEPKISAPTPSADAANAFPSSSQHGLSSQQLAETKNSQKSADQPATGLQAEAASLEEVLKNQVRPKNLVAIKKSGTPVVASPSLTGKTLFLADEHDEFEMLDFNADWVHVRISGLSRGWIWRTSLEMPEGISDVPLENSKGAPVVADLFQVTREETAPFPGDWGPLQGKNVKIISVQKITEGEQNSGAQAKLEFAKSLLDKNYAELAAKSQELSGIVMIFDSVDGGLIAATFPTVRQWKAGALNDAALWHQCYFDPPETFTVAGPGGGP